MIENRKKEIYMNLEKGSMLKVLQRNLRNWRKLTNDTDAWKSLFIDYEKPHVERVYRDLEDGNRLSIHVLHYCNEGEEFFHPHPWPSAMYILKGRYEMHLGFSESLEKPKTSTTITLNEGSFYEMVNPNEWHSVRPLDSYVYTVMVSGPVWQREIPQKPEKKMETLTNHRKENILDNVSLKILNGIDLVDN